METNHVWLATIVRESDVAITSMSIHATEEGAKAALEMFSVEDGEVPRCERWIVLE